MTLTAPPLWQWRLVVCSVPLRGSPILASPVATGEVASNASRWGRLCLACTSDAMEDLQLAFMAPPPPLTRSPSPALAGEAGGTLRPLAGFWFLNNIVGGLHNGCGQRFRPLAGFWFLNFAGITSPTRSAPMFPSPCGVLVIKCGHSMTTSVISSTSFRPLAGFWFLNNGYQSRVREVSTESFRPLAGFWFLNQDC